MYICRGHGHVELLDMKFWWWLGGEYENYMFRGRVWGCIAWSRAGALPHRVGSGRWGQVKSVIALNCIPLDGTTEHIHFLCVIVPTCIIKGNHL